MCPPDYAPAFRAARGSACAHSSSKDTHSTTPHSGCRTLRGGFAFLSPNLVAASSTAPNFQPSGRAHVSVPRNVVPVGLGRFESGPLPKQEILAKLSPRVMSVLAGNPSAFTLNGTNIGIVGTGPRRLIVDTGELQQADLVSARLAEIFAQENIEGISGIIVTHLHHDHCALAKRLRADFGKGNCPIWKWPTNPWDTERRRDMVSEARIKEGITDDSMPKTSVAAWSSLNFEETSNYLKLSEGQVVRTEGATLRAFWTPGHAMDHVVLFLEEERALFTGDLILGYGTSWVEDLALYMQSLHKVRLLGALRFFPGHGPACDAAPLLIERYIGHRDARERAVLEILLHAPSLGSGERVGLTSKELTSRLYSETPAQATAQAESNVLKILVKLKKEGHVFSFAIGSQLPLSLDDAQVEGQVKQTGSDGKAEPPVALEEYDKQWVAVLDPAQMEQLYSAPKL